MPGQELDPVSEKFAKALRTNALNFLTDTVTFTASATKVKSTIQLFTTESAAANKFEKNVIQNGQFPFTYYCKGIKIVPYDPSGALDIDMGNKIMNNIIINWQKGAKQLMRDQPIMLFPAGAGIIGTKTTEAAAQGTGTVGAGVNGSADIENYVHINPETFEKGEALDIKITLVNDIANAITHDVKLMFALVGVSAESIA